eukprot:8472509-Karenia_brevis.AAC.1
MVLAEFQDWFKVPLARDVWLKILTTYLPGVWSLDLTRVEGDPIQEFIESIHLTFPPFWDGVYIHNETHDDVGSPKEEGNREW